MYNGIYRQVFMDARPLPKNPNPSWQGYSSAKWSGDTLEIDSVGFRDDLWIDWDGSVITEAAKVRERIRRPDFGHLDIEITVDDPKAYTKPWTVTVHQQFAADTELIDEICAEGERFSKHSVNGAPRRSRCGRSGGWTTDRGDSARSPRSRREQLGRKADRATTLAGARYSLACTRP